MVFISPGVRSIVAYAKGQSAENLWRSHHLFISIRSVSMSLITCVNVISHDYEFSLVTMGDINKEQTETILVFFFF